MGEFHRRYNLIDVIEMVYFSVIVTSWCSSFISVHSLSPQLLQWRVNLIYSGDGVVGVIIMVFFFIHARLPTSQTTWIVWFPSVEIFICGGDT